MNQFSPKEFLKRRAVSLYRSGVKPPEIARMLSINVTTAHCWVNPDENNRRALRQQMRRAEKVALEREALPDLPTLPFVPQIQLTKQSKYQMRAP